jgi:hypothetical protein
MMDERMYQLQMICRTPPNIRYCRFVYCLLFVHIMGMGIEVQQIANPQILGLASLSQIRKIPMCASPQIANPQICMI